MSSDHDESLEQSNESNKDSKAELNGSPPPKKLHRDNTNEHAKPKRRGRRGKKRKQRKESGGGAPCPGEHQEECKPDPAECEKHSLSWDSDEDDVETEDFFHISDVIIRPVNVPKAPLNSTQFIIDDHNECQLYMSFETPNPYIANYCRGEEDDSEIIEPVGEDAAYEDIDYEYESPHDFDNSAYYDREFELSYKNNRFDELMRLPHDDLISGLENLENRLRDLNNDLVKEDPDPILEKLQSELLELQERNIYLQKENADLNSFMEESGIDHAAVAEDSDTALLSEEISDVYLEVSMKVSHQEDHNDLMYLEEGDDGVHPKTNYPVYLGEEESDLADSGNLPVQNCPVYLKNTGEDSSVNTGSDGETIVQVSNYQKNVPFSQDVSECFAEQESVPSSQDIDNSSCMDYVNTGGEREVCSKDTVFGENLQISELANHKDSCCMDTYNEHIPAKEKVILRDSEYCENKHCEEMTLGAVPEEHEQLNAVAV